MPELITTTSITCPYCWEAFDTTLDLSVGDQEYVEDCFVCCRPILISFRTDQGTLIDVSATSENP